MTVVSTAIAEMITQETARSMVSSSRWYRWRRVEDIPLSCRRVIGSDGRRRDRTAAPSIRAGSLRRLAALDGGFGEVHHLVAELLPHLLINRTRRLTEFLELGRRELGVLHATLDQTLARGLVLALGNRALLGDCSRHCPLNGILLVRRELLERRLVDHVPRPVEEVPCVRKILLHFVEFAHEHVVVRVLLPVDDSLLQRLVQLLDVDRSGIRAERTERKLPRFAGGRADLQALDIVDRLDRPLVVRDVPRADVPPADDQHALIRHRGFHVPTEVAVDLAERLLI